MMRRSLVIRLARKFGISEEDAEKLVAAGLDTPAKVKEARPEDVEKVIGKEKAGKALGRFKVK
jgi:hypothetical protein